MTKKIETLVQDINSVVQGKGGWTKVINEEFKEKLGAVMESRLYSSKPSSKPTLRMSNIGEPCKRKLWYTLNTKGSRELPPEDLLKFLYGDMLEQLLLSLAKAAGHKVEGEQDRLDCFGIKGSRDAVIDGLTVDVKSASPSGFKKFKYNSLRHEDPFGYIRQLTGYVKAAEKDPLVTYKKEGAFLVINKVSGELVLDRYELEPELETMEKYIGQVTDYTRPEHIPEREYLDKEYGDSGNRILGQGCFFCPYKGVCWPGLRTFQYNYGPVYFTEVVKEPRVPEIKET